MTARPPRSRPAAAALSLLMLPPLLLASACKDEPRVTVTADGTTVVDGPGEVRVVEAADGASLPPPAGLPGFAPAYPGARLATRIGGDAVGEGRGTLLVFETTDPVEKVAAFYDARAKEAGAAAAVMVTEPDSAVRVYGGKTEGEGAMVAISRNGSGPGSEIVITSGMQKADVVQLERKPDEWRRTVRMPVRLQ